MKARICAIFGAFIGLPMVANAAGTYYTGAAYQPAQYRYGQSGTYATSGYGRTVGGNSANSMPSVRYNGYAQPSTVSYQTQNANVNQVSTRQTQQAQKTSNGTKSGFFVNGGISHENAMWKFEMKNVANSILHYDNIGWNVLDLNGGYVFDLGKTKMQVDAGFKYGMQWGDASMNDDDISNGGYSPVDLVDDDDNVVGQMVGHALSVGTSNDGNMLGFNVGFGLPDFFSIGNLRMTPSIGYRYLKYKLTTKNNYGLSVSSAACFAIGGGEVQCDPAIFAYYQDTHGDWQSYILWRDNLNNELEISSGTSYVDTGDTYYYEQSGTSHSYETVWSGPYIALDMLYDINQYNYVNARFELGFPGYTSTGDQPYRWDWAHPKSVEDSAGMFSALHLGMGANWKTAISNSVWLSFGFTYDYYSVSGADATTYLNKDLYYQILASYNNDEEAMLNPTTGDLQAIRLNETMNSCGGWACKSKKEIDSVYKSMGIRIGIDARF